MRRSFTAAIVVARSQPSSCRGKRRATTLTASSKSSCPIQPDDYFGDAVAFQQRLARDTDIKARVLSRLKTQ